jgi:hypothetical protein
VGKYGRARQATDDNMAHMRTACWITKATDTDSEDVILTAFPRQQWLRERAFMSRYTYLPVLFSYSTFRLVVRIPVLHSEGSGSQPGDRPPVRRSLT